MKQRMLLFAGLLIFVLSCEKESALERYYYQEGNSSSSIYDAIDTSGLFTEFLLGVDSAGYANQLRNTLVTVIAPSDEAFQEYLSGKGYNSIMDMPKAEMEDLIGNHLITWPHSPTSFEIDPLYYKRQTNMASRTVDKYDPILGINRNIVSEAKYMQFYFPEMLEYYLATEDDYELLTGTELSPSTNFNLYDVQVDSIVPFGNGWVYYVDKVIEPRQNLDDWLLESDDYSLFSQLFNRYNLYYVDSYVSNAAQVKRSNVFQNNRYYRIDMELCFETVGYIRTGNFYISHKASSGYTVLAPKNDVLEHFIDSAFADYEGFKESLGTVNLLTLDQLHIHKIIRAIISPYLFVDQLYFPSNFASQEGVNGIDGTNFKFDSDEFSELTLCSNGYAYGIDEYVVPRTFKSILKHSFTSSDYKYFAAAVRAAQITGFMNNVDADYTLMLPTDSAFIRNGILLLDVPTFNAEYGGSIDQTNGLTETVFLDLNNPDAPMDVMEIFPLVFSHLFTEAINPSSEVQFAKNATGDYVGFSLDSVWSGGNTETRWLNDTVIIPDVIASLEGADNGNVYVINDLIQSPAFSIGRMLNENPEYSRFKDICQNAGLLNGNNMEITGNYPSLFVPTNAAIDQFIADGNLPSNEEDLQNFINYFFADQAVFTSVNINETVNTLCKDEEQSSEFSIVYKTVDLNGVPGNLQIKGTNNDSYLQVIEGNNSNVICTDGIIHLVDGVLNF